MNFLFLEENFDDVELAVHELIYAGFEFDYKTVDTEEAFIKEMPLADVIYVDCVMPKFTCEDALLVWHETGEQQPFIIVSGAITNIKGAILKDIGATAVVLKNELHRIGIVTRLALSKFYNGDNSNTNQ